MSAQNSNEPFRMSPPADMNEGPEAEPERITSVANALLATAWLAIVLNCVGGITINTLTSSIGDPPHPAGMTDDEFYYHKLGKSSAPFLRAVAISIPTFAIYPLAILGANRMKQRRGYWLAVVSSLLVMLPCSLMFIVGFPVGCWALAVLRKPSVKKAFAEAH